MPINTKELLDCLYVILDEENMKVTFKETGKGTLVCAATCFVGGLLAGPVGLAVGGALGGLGAASLTQGLLAGPVGLAVGGTLGGIAALVMTKDSFKSVSEVIKNDLTVAQREKLAQTIFSAINEFHPQDAVALLALLADNGALQKSLIQTVGAFLTKEMQLRVID